MLASGSCFLAGEDDDEKLHLRVVVTDPTPSGEVVVVSITTRRARSEPLVILNPGDHPFIQHESVVAYRYSEITSLAVIEQAIQSKKAKERETVAAELLRRIQRGLLDSDFTPNGVRYFAKEVLTCL
jgi:hypothetical protein